MNPSLRHLLIACCLAICAVSTLGAQAFLCGGHAPAGPLSAAKIAADVRLSVLPASGSIYILTVFARFADEAPTPVPAWADQLFDAEREGSFAHFYRAMSFLDFWAHDASYARARGGNLGDASDLFDGVRYRRLAVETNPSTLATPTLSQAITGLTLQNMRPDGDGMALDVVMPRWGGALREEVHWAGEVLIDGDLTVAPAGRLVVFRNTQIRVAGSDRLQTGLDPARTELHIRGDFVIRSAAISQIANRCGGRTDRLAGRLRAIAQFPQPLQRRDANCLPLAARGAGAADCIQRHRPAGAPTGQC